MSESRSSTKSHDSFNQNVEKVWINELFEDTFPMINLPNYNHLYDCIKQWLSTPNLGTMKEEEIQLNFYQNCMKVYDSHIDRTLKYTSNYTGTVFKKLFGRLVPDFCRVDYYNAHAKSSSSGLDL
ncbi:unnamed protein product [Rotaria sp. Silwood2]|nr:unnamed protein product [Rotaria sp. Silwood2]CAF3091085.1 unnamed protein product [Rotaria sp. Silwood2]CAF3414553.1 unnamed protein product [Rotaria sp. Silwood2]CAF4416102.1 unnamed protein product [Rotaria sp. Silwood2]CAF4515161.1 unnamed protein product [Rotaria sp. Silwood2]